MTRPYVVPLPCGCFFQGRKLIQCEACAEPEDEQSFGRCASCGDLHLLDDLDSKPTLNSRLRRIKAREGQRVMLRRAADLGFDFDRLECPACYGPGYQQNA